MNSAERQPKLDEFLYAHPDSWPDPETEEWTDDVMPGTFVPQHILDQEMELFAPGRTSKRDALIAALYGHTEWKIGRKTVDLVSRLIRDKDMYDELEDLRKKEEKALLEQRALEQHITNETIQVQELLAGLPNWPLNTIQYNTSLANPDLTGSAISLSRHTVEIGPYHRISPGEYIRDVSFRHSCERFNLDVFPYAVAETLEEKGFSVDAEDLQRFIDQIADLRDSSPESRTRRGTLAWTLIGGDAMGRYEIARVLENTTIKRLALGHGFFLRVLIFASKDDHVKRHNGTPFFDLCFEEQAE